MPDTVKVIYKPKKGEPWIKEVPEAQAKKMVKLGRWKYVNTPAPAPKPEATKK